MNVFVKLLIGFLLLFTPFAFAGTEPWAFTVIQGIICVAWIFVLYSRKTLYKTPLSKPIGYTMGILIIFALLQALFPQTLLQSVPAWHPITLMRLYTLEHTSLFVTWLALAALIPQLYPSQQEIKHLLEWAVVCALLVILVAIGFPKGEYIFRLAGVRGGIGPFLNRNHASVFFSLNALIALGLFFTKGLESARRVISSRSRRNFILQQVCLATIFIALAVATIMTRSRGGMLSLLIGLFSYSFLYFYAIPRQFKKRLKNIFLTLVVLILTTGWIVTHTQDINAFSQRGTGSSEQTRRMLYATAFNMLKDYPVWGIGIGAMPVAIPAYMPYMLDSYVERLHNDWLEMLLGVGYLGACFVLFGLGWFCWRALRLLKRLELRKQLLFISLLSVLVAMSVGSLVDFHFFIPANALLFFMVLGITVAPSYAAGHVHQIEVNGLIKFFIVSLLMLSLYIPTKKTLAWRLGIFGSGLKHEAKSACYAKALGLYPSPRYALRLAASYWNAALHASSPQEQKNLIKKAHAITLMYLQLYPRDKELSYLYVRIQKKMGKQI